MNLIEVIATSLMSNLVISGGAYFILKNYFLNELQKNLENHKFSLQKEILKAQVLTNYSAEIYKNLYREIEIAYGATASLLGPRVVNSWHLASPTDVEKYLQNRGASQTQVNSMSAIFSANDPQRGKKMNDLFFQLDVHDGEMKHREAKNFLIANSLFVEEGVEKTCFEILNQIHAGLVALNLVIQGGPSQLVAAEYAKDATLRTKIDGLKIDIRQILVPAQ